MLRNEASSAVCIAALHDEEDASCLRMTSGVNPFPLLQVAEDGSIYAYN